MKTMKHQSLAAVFLGAGLMVAPFALAEHETGEEQADQRLGEGVDRICFGRNINGWKTVDREDGVLLLKKNASNWYRVELTGGCQYRVLRRAFTVGIDSRPAGGCIQRGDILIVEDRQAFTQRCAITRMNAWDDRAPAPGEEETEEAL